MLSILMPAYNAAPFVAAAISSITQQKLDCDYEILVCNDASTDETGEIVADLAARDARIKLITHKTNRGIAAARNTMLDNVEPLSQFIVFFDADDVLAPGGLTNGLSRLMASPDHMLVSGRLQTVPSAQLEAGGPVADHWPKIAGVFMGMVVFRRELVDRIGKFDTSFTQGDDSDFMLRAGELTNAILFHDDVVYYYRRHANNVTNDLKTRTREFMRALLLHTHRRRADPSLFEARAIVQGSNPEELKRSMDLHG